MVHASLVDHSWTSVREERAKDEASEAARHQLGIRLRRSSQPVARIDRKGNAHMLSFDLVDVTITNRALGVGRGTVGNGLDEVLRTVRDHGHGLDLPLVAELGHADIGTREPILPALAVQGGLAREEDLASSDRIGGILVCRLDLDRECPAGLGLRRPLEARSEGCRVRQVGDAQTESIRVGVHAADAIASIQRGQ
jgi:hypothetical protein